MTQPRPPPPRLDLNLLLVFQVLMQERNLTKAAKRLFVTQPAVSHKLQRLRAMLQDPLLVRTAHGLTPTPRALELYEPIEAAVAQLTETIAGAAFEPAAARGVARVQVPDSLCGALLPCLYQATMDAAPHLRLSFDNTAPNNLALLAAGEIDFSIYHDQDHDSGILAFPIGTTPVVCWMRHGHPLSKGTSISLSDVTRFPRIDLSYSLHTPSVLSAAGATLQALEENRPVMRASQLLGALAVASRSDAVVIGVPFFGSLPTILGGLTYRPIMELANDPVPLFLFQHVRTERSNLHNWLRSLILDCWDSSVAGPDAPSGRRSPTRSMGIRLQEATGLTRRRSRGDRRPGRGSRGSPRRRAADRRVDTALGATFAASAA